MSGFTPEEEERIAAQACRGEAFCEQPVAGYVGGLAVCETHLAAEFERRVGAGEEVSIGGVTPGPWVHTDYLPEPAPARPGSIVLYCFAAEGLYAGPDRGEPLLPAVVIATPESRAEALERAGRHGAELLTWFPDFQDPLVRHLEEPVHLAVFNPEPARPLLFVPRVGRGEGAGEWRWAS